MLTLLNISLLGKIKLKYYLYRDISFMSRAFWHEVETIYDEIWFFSRQAKEVTGEKVSSHGPLWYKMRVISFMKLDLSHGTPSCYSIHFHIKIEIINRHQLVYLLYLGKKTLSFSRVF